MSAVYGKTTLVGQWRERDERSFAWLSLDRVDNDPAVLATAVASALCSALGLDIALIDELGVPEPELDQTLAPLVDECAGSGRQCVLVLDDLHLVTRDAATQRSSTWPSS